MSPVKESERILSKTSSMSRWSLVATVARLFSARLRIRSRQGITELIEHYVVASSNVSAAAADGRQLSLGWVNHRVTIVEIGTQGLAHQL